MLNIHLCVTLILFEVPLGVMLRNENKLDEMSQIMEGFHRYVPTQGREGELTLPNGASLSFDNTAFYEILFGGDQLTVARALGVQNLRIGHETALDRLERPCSCTGRLACWRNPDAGRFLCEMLNYKIMCTGTNITVVLLPVH